MSIHSRMRFIWQSLLFRNSAQSLCKWVDEHATERLEIIDFRLERAAENGREEKFLSLLSRIHLFPYEGWKLYFQIFFCIRTCTWATYIICGTAVSTIELKLYFATVCFEQQLWIPPSTFWFLFLFSLFPNGDAEKRRKEKDRDFS